LAATGPTGAPAAVTAATGATAAPGATAAAVGTAAAAVLRDLQTAVNNRLNDNPQLKQMMDGIIERAHGDEEMVRKELASWFDNAMDRVSGVYKRWAQLFSFLFALVFAVLLNISTIEVAQKLWRQPVDIKPFTTAYDPSKVTDAAKVDLSATFKLLETM